MLLSSSELGPEFYVCQPVACAAETFSSLAAGRLENRESIGKRRWWGGCGPGSGSGVAGRLQGAELPVPQPSLARVGLASVRGEWLRIDSVRCSGAFSYPQCSWPSNQASNLRFWIKSFLLAMTLGCSELRWGRNRAAGGCSGWVLGSWLAPEGAALPPEQSRAHRRLSLAVTSPRRGRGRVPAQR